MAEHTKEPWRRAGTEIWAGSTRICFGRGAYDPKDAATRNANLRRIVACVNACAGIPTEMLERNIFHRSPVTLAIAAAMADMEKEAGE